MSSGVDCNDYICKTQKQIVKIQKKETYRERFERKSNTVPEGLPWGNEPLDVVGLGNSTWPILHRMTLSYPNEPTEE